MSMQANGMILIVVVVLVIILLGLFAFLFFTERKLNKLEKVIKEKEKETNNKG